MTRTSTCDVLAPPTGSKRCSSSARRTLAWVLQAHVADLVQEKRAAVGLLELSDLVFVRAGEDALAVAEQLALDQLLRNGGAVHLDEGLFGAQALGVDGVGHQLLARAALAVDQDAAVGGGHQRDLLAQRLHRRRFRR